MSYHVVKWLRECATSFGISPTDLAVAVCLGEHADHEGGHAYPSIEELTLQTLLSERTVRRSLRELEAAGVVAVERPACQHLPTMYCFPGFRDDDAVRGVRVAPLSAAVEPRGANVTPLDEFRGANVTPLDEFRGASAPVRGVTVAPPYKEVEKVRERLDTPSVSPPKYSALFATFWGEYPRGHGTKTKAYAEWKKHGLNRDDHEEERTAVMAGLRAWVGCEQWRDGYVKWAERWLRDRGWEDVPPPPRRNGRLSQADLNSAKRKAVGL